MKRVLALDEAREVLAEYPAWDTRPPRMPDPRPKWPGECPLCGFPGGRGFLQAFVPPGHRLFGKLIYCECWGNELPQLLARVSGLSGELQNYDLAQMKTDRGRRAAWAAASRFVDNPIGFLTLYGTYGTGKTFTLAGIVNALRKRLVQGLYVQVPDLLDSLRDSYGEGQYNRLLTDMRNVRVLALDELGQAKATDWAMEKLFQILEHRYNHSSALGTVIALHFDPASPPGHLPERMGAIVSRLKGTMGVSWPVVEMSGGDLRGVER